MGPASTLDAFIVDAVRTPVGRYRGALAGVRPDDLAAHAIAKAVERTGIDPAAVCDVYLGAANQAGEDNRDAARMAALLAGLPAEVPGVTVNRLCASGLEAVNQASRALRLGEGDLYLAGGAESMSRAPMGRPEAGCRAAARAADDARHIARLAPHQPADGRALLDRVDGRDRRERGGALRNRPRGAGQVRAPKPHSSGGGDARGAVRRRAGAGRGPIPERSRRPGGGRGRRRTPRRHLAREARPPAPRVSRGRHGDGRQRVNAQRRRRLPRSGHRPARGGARRPSPGPDRLDRRRRRRSRLHGHGPGARDPAGARRCRPVARRHRPDRDQRGVRVPGPRLRRRARDRGGAAERERRGDRPRPPARLLRRPPHDHARLGVATPRGPLRGRGALRGRRAGRGDDRREPRGEPERRTRVMG